MTRHLRLAALQIRISAAAGMAYRADFLLEGGLALLSLGLMLLPWFVLFEGRDTVAEGWTRTDALVVIAYFTAVRAVLEGLISPSLVDFVERIRSGAFDYVLLKPADAQVLVSSSRCEPWQVCNFLFAIGLAVYALAERGAPAPGDVALGLAMFAAGLGAMYALWLLCAAAAFWVVRLDNLTFLLSSIFDVARWPVQVFRGAWRFVFTFIIPVAVMTTFPAMALLGELRAEVALGAVGGAIALLGVSRLVWRLAIRSYTSASS